MNPTCKAVPTATHQSGGASPLAPLLPGFRCSRMRVELLSHGGGGALRPLSQLPSRLGMGCERESEPPAEAAGVLLINQLSVFPRCSPDSTR